MSTRAAYDPLMGEEELVTVRTCNYLHEAELIKSVLEAEGIEAQIPDAYMAGVQTALGAAIGGIRVVVSSLDLDRAEMALAAMVAAE